MAAHHAKSRQKNATSKESPADDGEAAKLIEAMLGHVPFTGWSDISFKAACADIGLDETSARGLFQRGALDVAKALHRQGDAAMISRFFARDGVEKLKLREKITGLIMERLALMGAYRPAVRASLSFFALAPNSADGVALIWASADKVWNAVGDQSDDFNWYSKRIIFSSVYMASLVYWLDDDSPDFEATRAFVERRVENIMALERVKSRLRQIPLLSAGENWLNGVGRKCRQRAEARFSGVPASLGKQDYEGENAL